MAKAKSKESEVKLVSGELESKLKNNLKNTPKKEEEIEETENTTIDKGIKIEKVEEPTVAPAKMVRILMAENHKCFIGGEWYYLIKDKHYNVPENVKNILLKANILRPL